MLGKKLPLFKIRLIFPSVLIFLLFPVCTVNKTSRDMSIMPDVVLMNGKIITVDQADSLAEAVAIKNGKISAVGSNAMANKWIGQNTQVIDLRGLTATPGLIDAHCHFAAAGRLALYTLDLSFPGVRKISDVLERVKAKAETLGPGEWITGRGWDEGKLQELRYVYASDLDPVSANNPVWIRQTMGHYGTANSRALELAKITKNTPDPPGGTIDRYADGTPTGVLKESAMSMVMRLVPELTPEQTRAGIIDLAGRFNSEGMTAAKDPGIGLETWEAYQNVLAQGKLKVRIFALWNGGESIEYAEKLIQQVRPFTRPYLSTGDDRLISGGIKLYIDGSGGARTAWLYEEWNKNYKEIDKGNFGYPAFDPGTFRQMVKMYHQAQLHLGTHANGDRAIDWAVDSYALALAENPVQGLRHSIIHCSLPTDHALETMAEMQRKYDAGYPEADAVHLWWIGDTYAGNFGPERSLRLKPYGSFLKRGIRWAATSDYSVAPFPARYGLWSQMARKPLLGVFGETPFGEAESIDVHNALRAYTIWSAHQLFLENKIGSIEVGKYADIAIWDKDLYEIPLDQIKELRCQMTLLGGKIVFMADKAPLVISEARGE